MVTNPTVLIVDDHPLIRRGLRSIIGEHPRFKIIGEAADGREALRLLPCLKPQILVVDIDMPQLNGLETIRAVRRLPFSVKVIVLTMYKEEDMFNAAMDLGVKAYVLKESAANEVIDAIEKVDRDEPFISRDLLEVGQRRSERVRALLMPQRQIQSLTESERRILKLVGEDLTSKEIAQNLNLSVRTVDSHRLHICNKLNLRGTYSLLKFAFENGAYL